MAALNVAFGHQVRIRWLDFYDCFQIAAVLDQGEIGKFRHLTAIEESIEYLAFASLIGKIRINVEAI